MNTRLVLLSGLFLCVLLTGWVLYSERALTGRPTISPEGPDLFVDDMDLKFINTDGLLRYHVTAQRMEHFPYDEHAELVQPALQVYTDSRPAWRIRSEHGEITNGREAVRLLGSVEIRRLAGPGVRPLEIQTRDVTVRPDAETADTASPTRIRSERLEVEATGVHADFRNDSLELKSRVRGRYERAG